jgi:hypothetical protein
LVGQLHRSGQSRSRPLIAEGGTIRVKGAGSEQTDERPTATLDQVFAIASAIERRYRLMVLLATCPPEYGG